MSVSGTQDDKNKSSARVDSARLRLANQGLFSRHNTAVIQRMMSASYDNNANSF